MSWLLPRLRPGAALRLGAGRHALPTLSSCAEAVAGPSSLQGLGDGPAPHAAPCRQLLRCLSDGSQATKPAASPEEGALHPCIPKRTCESGCCSHLLQCKPPCSATHDANVTAEHIYTTHLRVVVSSREST